MYEKCQNSLLSVIPNLVAQILPFINWIKTEPTSRSSHPVECRGKHEVSAGQISLLNSSHSKHDDCWALVSSKSSDSSPESNPWLATIATEESLKYSAYLYDCLKTPFNENFIAFHWRRSANAREVRRNSSTVGLTFIASYLIWIPELFYNKIKFEYN